MRRARPFILLAICLALAVLSSSWVYRWLRAQASSREPVQVQVIKEEPTDVTLVAVASVEVPWGKHITEEMVEMVPYPVDYLPEGHFEDVEEVVGRIPKMEIRKNEPILEHKLAALDAYTGGVAAIMDPSKRAMSVRVDDEIGVAGFVKPGDRVDVFVTLKLKDRKTGKDSAFTKLVLAHTLVLAIGTEMVRMGEEDEPRPVKVITLEVSPSEAEKLAFAATQGKFRLALRHPLNTEPAYTRGADINSLISSYRLGGPAGKGMGDDKTIELIQGSEVSEVTF